MYLKNNNMSLRNVVKDHLYDKQVHFMDEEDNEVNQTKEVISAEKFFDHFSDIDLTP